MIFKAFMMCKDEGQLLRAWIAHHGALFGHYNLIVLDNGSTDELTRTVLAEGAAQGVNVQYAHAENHDFINKGGHIKMIIRSLNDYAPADFYFPLDCDEFVVVEKAPYEIDFTRSALEETLLPYVNSPDVLTIASLYENHTDRPSHFRHCTYPRDVFFARGGCVELDHGYHFATSPSGRESNTKVSYLHFHYRSVEEYIKSCMLKLQPYMDQNQCFDLNEFRQRELPGFHLVAPVLDRANYKTVWEPSDETFLPGVAEHFKALGLSEPHKG